MNVFGNGILATDVAAVVRETFNEDLLSPMAHDLRIKVTNFNIEVDEAKSQYQGRPVYVVNSTFGGAEGFGNTCANGGGISSVGVSWTILNSVFTHNHAIGEGGNPAQSGTPGGGSGGAIYNDGNTMTLSVCGTRIEDNDVRAYGSAIFFVSNDHSGTIEIKDSVIRHNTGGGWNVLPGISMHDDTTRVIENSTIEP